MGKNNKDTKIQKQPWYVIIMLLAAIATIIGFGMNAIFGISNGASTENGIDIESEQVSDNTVQTVAGTDVTNENNEIQVTQESEDGNNTYVEMQWEDVEIKGDINVGTTEITNNISYIYDSDAVDELTLANVYLRQGDYDEALSIYQREDFSENKAVLINMGYLYGNGLTYYGVDIQKAVDCYIKADCIEGYRNLLALCLKTGESELAENIMAQLIDLEDEVTLAYIHSCMKGTEYENMEITASEAADIIEDLYQWIDGAQWYNGYNPPEDTFSIRWIFQGIDSVATEDTNHPYCIFRMQKRIFSRELSMLEKCYYTTEDGVEELEIM